MERYYCYNCFAQREDPAGPCPYCGFDLEENVRKFPVALRAGTVLNGRYLVGRVLGQGGFGITYLALDTKLGAKVAIKEFMPGEIATRVDGTTVSVMADTKTQDFAYGAERFQEEARTLAKFIGHPNIAGVSNYFDENDTSYFVMDYIEGVSFKSYIANHGGKVSVDDALNVMIPVLRALTAVHQEGFIHRDVTPDNIYITKDGQVKLLDFGSARYSIGDKSKSLDVVLKVGYAPKEQYIRRGRQGPYTDVYSCAACFYAALTGYLPPESLERLDHDTLVPVSQAGIEIPEYLDKAILKGLAVQPEDRFQNAFEFLEAIENQQVVEIAQPGQAQAAPPEPAKKKLPLPVIIGGAAAVLAVVIGVSVFGGGGGSSDGKNQPPLIRSEVPSITIQGEEFSTDLRSLDLNNRGLEDSDIQDLKYMVNLTSLELDGNNLTDLEPLSGLTQLQRLYLGDGNMELSDLSPLSGLTNLTRLDLPINAPITDLSPLGEMTEMEELRISGSWNNTPSSDLKDLTPLSNMSNLTRLELVLTGDVDLSPLTGLSKLTELRIYGALELEDFSELSELTQLQILRIDIRGTQSAAGLEKLVELRELNVGDSSNNGHSVYISDLTCLSGLTKLQSLRFDVSGISSLKGLENLTELREANFYGSDATYTDVDPLKNLTKLQTLRLPMHGNNPPVFDASGLAGLTELTELDMECSVKSLEPLRNLTKLKVLSVRNGSSPQDGTAFQSLEPLSGLTSLTELSIRTVNSVTDLSPLQNLTNLRNLFLDVSGYYDDPPLTNISPLGALTKLQTLTLQERGLTDISPLKNCTSLSSLNIYEYGNDAKITDLSPVAHVANVSIT